MPETIDNFFNTRLVNYASYDNLRKIASCIDGLKNASRKVMYTVLEKNIKDNVKVLQLANKSAEFADYLHGDLSGVCITLLANKSAEFADYLHGDLSGVCITLGQDFSGTNNVPLLKKSGNFGTRSIHEASAPRYIFAKGSELFFKIYSKEDNDILDVQYFEGSKIEPRFYVPALPMLLINGLEILKMSKNISLTV